MPNFIPPSHWPEQYDASSLTIERENDEWREALSPESFHVLREEGTERPFENAYHSTKQKGVYRCEGCGQKLFLSDTKYDSGTGWPSFFAPVHAASVETTEDRKFFTTRTEVHCSGCKGHLGHVFTDGPAPTGQRYCMNSAALRFEPFTA
ncbi:peptide-methionine (R)-S-oxide reductase [Candidatus Peregrinibacteria bacterium CG10_big_fil_rev_8_21_14_0_10_49_24]|nr:MAG: peptide-methionine (R)-S-oxide reductase [Candidatus Peregrinibacteria bacterium CG11_big_fil_rev_8_21_14_0_20_49_14]PIR51179.1 MAG: peptide-methionine (R)-S-oxide reductase [Candidatus Peregrinibacteria bacterium CG10_big_fil_rev_8_21_14_0_10_49_24]PJA67218.1 MAG: peptide-methionine (R)-S-oxide reductase [Candidatus Peregrinibacteria bacterium CG_4_9_14_3_um_filter_49_12]